MTLKLFRSTIAKNVSARKKSGIVLLSAETDKKKFEKSVKFRLFRALAVAHTLYEKIQEIQKDMHQKHDRWGNNSTHKWMIRIRISHNTTRIEWMSLSLILSVLVLMNLFLFLWHSYSSFFALSSYYWSSFLLLVIRGVEFMRPHNCPALWLC